MPLLAGCLFAYLSVTQIVRQGRANDGVGGVECLLEVSELTRHVVFPKGIGFED